MTAPKRIIRGLQDIRTHSGNIDQGFVPYKAFMKLSCLEMEKCRRDKERKSALRRVDNIDARFADIETEKKAILEALKNAATGGDPRANRTDTRLTPRFSRNTVGFKFRY